ncbi:MAG: saccharopine dehydrogenase NADP-binding domain-containing protein [Archaeoglobaceae archaeon]
MDRIVVLGGMGHIGSKIVWKILEIDSSLELTIGDINVERAEEVVRDLGNVKVVKVNASREEELMEVLKGKEVVVNAVGPFYKFGVPVLKSAIRCGVDYIDIKDDYDSTADALNLKELAIGKKMTAIVGMGATPGITNLIAKYGSGRLDKVEEVGTYWVWTAIDPTMGPAIIEHYFHAITGMVKTYKDGELVVALSEPEIFEFPKPIGPWEVANVGHPEPITIPRYMKVRKVYNKGGIWPSELNEIAKVFSQLGLTGDGVINVGELNFKAMELAIAITMSLDKLIQPEELQKILANVSDRLGEYALTGVGLGVRLKGTKNGEECSITYKIACKDATEATALPCAITALKLLNEDYINGVYPPEAGVIDVKDILEELKKRFKIECSELRNYTL